MRLVFFEFGPDEKLGQHAETGAGWAMGQADTLKKSAVTDIFAPFLFLFFVFEQIDLW